MALTQKQALFIAAYQLDPNATNAALKAGYSSKSADQIGSRMIRQPKILAEIEQWRAEKRQDLTKDDFIDKAMGVYETLDNVEANKPRFLEIAGKTLGYLGGNGEVRPTQVNLTQINVNATGTKGINDLWQATRDLLGND